MSHRSVLSIWLAPAIVLAVLGLQLSARLPADSWLLAAALTAMLSGLAAYRLARAGPRAAGVLALIALALLLVAPGLTARLFVDVIEGVTAFLEKRPPDFRQYRRRGL